MELRCHGDLCQDESVSVSFFGEYNRQRMKHFILLYFTGKTTREPLPPFLVGFMEFLCRPHILVFLSPNMVNNECH